MVTQSGRQTLSSIDQGVRLVHGQIRDIDEQIREAGTSLSELQGQQGERYKRLASIRLDHVASGDVTSQLDVAGRRVRELLAQRTEAQAALDAAIKDAFVGLETLGGRRSGLEARADQASERLDGAEAEVQERLAQDGAYLAQLETAREAERIAEHAEEKTRRAEEARTTKGKPYEDDPLFSYLWARGYGTSTYAANSLLRYLDKWIAGLCNYRDARPNYAMLLEIPRRLNEHARRVRAASDAEFEKLKALEESAADADGVPALRQDVDDAQAALDDMDSEIESVEHRLRDLEGRRTRYTAGEDDQMQQAVEVLSNAFEREKLQTLYEYARATPTAEDDVLVQELDAGMRSAAAIRESLAEHKRVRERHLDRLEKLEEVRRRFKRQRYDNAHSEFGNAALVAMLLQQFLRGTATSDELWRTIEREQRYRRGRSNPDFGTGGFGRRRGTWHFPFPGGGGVGRGGWGGGGSGGVGGGGGFRTGGGF